MTFSWLKKLHTIWISPYSLAIPGTILFIFLLPDIFTRYRGEIIQSGLVNKKDGFEYYADLNGDGNSKRIVLFNNSEGKASIKILDQNDFIIDHIYFSGEIIPNSTSLVTGVFDSTGNTGIFLMTLRNDSVLLHGICPARKEKILFRDTFITTISKQNGKHDYQTSILLYDLNCDGTKEVICEIMAGFQVKPRLLVVYNFRAGHLQMVTPMANYQGVCDTADVNGDGRPELLAYSYAIGNNQGKYQLPYDDSSAWLSVYDSNLNFLFKPIQYPGQYIFLSPHVMKAAGKIRIVAIYVTRVPGTGPSKLMLFDSSGKFLKERILDDTLRVRNYNLIRSDGPVSQIFLVRENGVIEEVNSELDVISKKKIKGVTTTSLYQFDVDGDGNREFLFTASNGSPFVITRADFTCAVSITNPFDFGKLNFSVIRKSGSPGSLFIQCGNRFVICSYERNPIFYLKYPVYLMIYLLVLGFILAIRYLQRRALRQRYDAEKKIAEMQLLLLSHQLDPHFTFNTINSISASILQEKRDVANSNLLSLSRLMRSSVLHSDKLSRSLAEELDFLQNYISLIHSGMDGSFQFRIDLSEDVNLEWQVPKMITQIIVENAIKHGLKPLNRGGLLIIRINRNGHEIILEIEDNGIGRKMSQTNGDQGTGKGLSMIDQFISIINKFNQKKIRLTITDLEDEQGQPRGTLVHLSIPAGMNYRFYEK